MYRKVFFDKYQNFKDHRFHIVFLSAARMMTTMNASNDESDPVLKEELLREKTTP